MDRNALDWLFSTAPQALAALMGLVITGVVLLIGQLEKLVERDPTLNEIIQKVKRQIYDDLMILLGGFSVVMVIDIVFLWLDPVIQDTPFKSFCKLDDYYILSILTLLFNIVTIICIVCFVSKILNPNFIDNTVKQLSADFKRQEQTETHMENTHVFFDAFVEFEKAARKFIPKEKQFRAGPTAIVNILQSFELINNDEYQQLLEIVRVRNMCFHGGNIKYVPRKYISLLKTITSRIQSKIEEKQKYRN